MTDIGKLAIVHMVFPRATQYECYKLIEDADEKKLNWDTETVDRDLSAIMSARVRHNCTDYDTLIKEITVEEAREKVQPEVSRQMRMLRGYK